MRRSALAAGMSALAPLSLSAPLALADAERVVNCTPAGQAHDLLIQQKFVAPFRALGEALRGGQGDAVGVQLCRLGELFVYDITMLQRDGRVLHTLVNARTGVIVAPGRSGK